MTLAVYKGLYCIVKVSNRALRNIIQKEVILKPSSWDWTLKLRRTMEKKLASKKK